MMDHWNTPNQQSDAAAPDMQYLTKPRGRGYSLRMVTPEVLIGTTNPFTKKPFGKEIKLGLNTQVHAEAVRLRDVRIGAIRQLEAEALAEAGKRHIGRIIELTPEAAEGWRKERARDTSEEGLVDLILSTEIDKAVESGKDEEAYRFADMVYRGAMPLDDMLEQYLTERSPNNPFGYDPLSRTTALDVRSSIKHFKTFLGVEHPTLRDATPDKVFKFRTEYLPLVARVSPGTINKHTTLLRGLWKWAIVDKKYVKDKRGRSVTNPWEIRERGTSKRKATHKSPEESRTAFTAKQVNTLLSGFSQWGARQGDLMRLMLVTGCRIDEIGSLLLKDVQETGESFRITSGKTDNAARYVPVVEAAMSLLAQRYAHANARQQDLPFHERRLFPEWPLKPATGKVNSASQWFTRYRRQALGTDTDTRLTAHSFRHTWRTVARRANVSEDRVKELGGWSGDRETSQIYDHGLPEDILQQTQTKIWQALLDGGFLKTF